MLLVLFAAPAFAYGEAVHHLLTRTCIEDPALAGPVAAIDPSLPAQLWAQLDQHARAMPTEGAAWQARYPNGLDAWSYKELLLLAPAATVWGVDRVDISAESQLLLMAQGARQPDDDYRNRDRLAYDAQRKPLQDAAGKPVPADPALLNMGKLGALSSQAHAHYGLPPLDFSADSAVLQTEPKRFAVASSYPAGPILTLAAEMAQLHLDLSLLAALSDAPGAQELSLLHNGQAFHYLQDTANPIHTVQVGLYDFFVDAFKARMWLSFKTGGGYLGTMRSLASIGIDILGSHHVLSENLTEKRLLEADSGQGTPEAEAILVEMKKDDPALVKRLDTALGADHPERGEFGFAITRALMEVSADYGDDVYRATREIADPRYRQEGVLFDDETDPDLSVQKPSPENAAAYASFWKEQSDSMRRAGTVMRRWMALRGALLSSVAADPAARDALRSEVADRLVRRQLKLLGEAEARRADYLKNPPSSVTQPERMPGMLAGQVGGVALLAGVGVWLRRRRA